MKFKLVFATATAVGLLMATGAVYAGSNNHAATLQNGAAGSTTGNQNVIGVDQTGATNSSAGGTSDNNLWLTQDGQFNDISITQNQDNNSVGLTAPGVNQSQSGNYLYVSQGATEAQGNNTVGAVQQTAGTGNATYVNQTSITQDRYENVGRVDQNYTGPGNANTANITEAGANYTGATNNNVNSVTQDGAGNATTINISNPGGAANGVGSFTAPSAADAAAGEFSSYLAPYGLGFLSPVIGQGTVTQNGTGNSVSMSGSASGTLFGFYQRGAGNTVSGTISGSGNAIATTQPLTYGGQIYYTLGGTNNDVGVGQYGLGGWADAVTGGDSNHLAILQIGVGGGNTASSTLDGDDNVSVQLQAAVSGNNSSTINVHPGSDNNIVATVQLANGGDNNAGVTVQGGSNNMAVVAQYGNGAANNATVAINGANNNKFYHATFTGGEAAALATTEGTIRTALNHAYSGLGDDVAAIPTVGAGLAGANLLTPGLMTQVGSGHYLNVSVDGSNNLFSTFQEGASDSITALIGNAVPGSDGNQFAIAQVGTSNAATVTQNGNGNTAAVLQNGVGNSSTINQ